MRARNRAPSKTGVTRVTRVTPSAKHPDSLAFVAVTHSSGMAFHRCNVDQTCNAKTSTGLLPANVLFASREYVHRCLSPNHLGRGIERYTLGAVVND